MKRTLLNVGFAVACIIDFAIAIVISFQVGMAVILRKAYAAWKTDWSDQVGTIYRDIDLNEADKLDMIYTFLLMQTKKKTKL